MYDLSYPLYYDLNDPLEEWLQHKITHVGLYAIKLKRQQNYLVPSLTKLLSSNQMDTAT